MSRRRERGPEREAREPGAGKRQGAERHGGAADRTGGSARPPRPPFAPGMLVDTAILLGVFAIVTAVAELAGAANLGVALGIGQIAFGIALVAVIVRDARAR